jgi:hypothetical protein
LPGVAAGIPGGNGGAPLAPGTGSALPFGKVDCCGKAVGLTLAGIAPGVPGLAVGLIEALGGTGNLPCWISEARCVTAAGNAGPAARSCPAAAAAAAGLPGGIGGAGRLITVLMITVLWMLL